MLLKLFGYTSATMSIKNADILSRQENLISELMIMVMVRLANNNMLLAYQIVKN